MTKFEEKLDKLELQNIKYREEIARMQKSLRKKNKSIKDLNESVKNIKSERDEWKVDANQLDKEKDEFIIENEKLKSQLQQQALPVVPECVAIWIKKCQELNWMITDVLAPEGWESDFAKDTEKWLKESKENFNLLALAFITGKYQVEKPKLFYLKHIDMSETNEHYDYYSTKNQDGSLNHVGIEKRWTPKTLDYTCKFTQAEINSMNTGSYEQIKVEEEK